MRVASLLLLVCAGCSDGAAVTDGAAAADAAATACPATQPAQDHLGCSPIGVTCDYGAMTCRCLERDPSKIAFVCLPPECFVPDGQCTPNRGACIFGFEDTEYCNSQRHWVHCDGVYCYDQDACAALKSGDRCGQLGHQLYCDRCYCDPLHDYYICDGIAPLDLSAVVDASVAD